MLDINGHSNSGIQGEEHNRPHGWDRPSHRCHENAISYSQALESLAEVAEKQKGLLRDRPVRRSHTETPSFEAGHRCDTAAVSRQSDGESISVLEADGRVCAISIYAPCSTPATDTSAMDGFALASKLTAGASTANPLRFRVAGIIAAGAMLDRQTSTDCNVQLLAAEPLCIEIMTGACFPERLHPDMDAVVKIEDVTMAEDCASDDPSPARYIYVSSPVNARQHRRPAGSDFCKDDMIIQKGARVKPTHVMALTSVGLSSIQVLPEPTQAVLANNNDLKQGLRIGVLPTGSELLNLFEQRAANSETDVLQQRFPDSNGPYITAAVRSISPAARVDYMGPCADDEDSLASAIAHAVHIQQCDVLVTSGGVSMGRFDLVRKVLSTRFDTDIVFHGCLIRPGAPVLCAVVHRYRSRDRNVDGTTVVIGAPGNPLAAAAAVRFFLQPLLEMLQVPQPFCNDEGIGTGTVKALSESATVMSPDPGYRKPSKMVAFVLARRHASLDEGRETPARAEILGDQSSYKIKPLLQSDCWVLAPAGSDKITQGSELQTYSLW